MVGSLPHRNSEVTSTWVVLTNWQITPRTSFPALQTLMKWYNKPGNSQGKSYRTSTWYNPSSTAMYQRISSGNASAAPGIPQRGGTSCPAGTAFTNVLNSSVPLTPKQELLNAWTKSVFYCAHVKLGSSLQGTAAAASPGSMQSAHLVNWTASSFIFLHTKETHFQCWESAEFLSLPIAQNKPSKSNVCEYWKGHCWQSKF